MAQLLKCLSCNHKNDKIPLPMRNLSEAVGSVALIRVDTGSFLGPAAKLSLLNQLSLDSTRNPVSKSKLKSHQESLWHGTLSSMCKHTYTHPYEQVQTLYPSPTHKPENKTYKPQLQLKICAGD